MTSSASRSPGDPVAARARPGGGTRDHRVDALRGVALLMMFVDHIPQNVLNRFTLRNVGFADAAEIFVLLAGYASWLAYGRNFDRVGLRAGVDRVLRRCARLYVFQAVMVVVTTATIRRWRHFWPVPVDFLEPELAHGLNSFWRVMFLDALPSNLNILPLYIVLLLAFPLIYLLIRRGLVLTLMLSGGLWVLINVDPTINFPNWLDPDGWYFDPLAWQFLFTLGACAAVLAGRHGGSLPRVHWLRVLCCAYLAVSALEAFPWSLWGLPDLRPFAVAAPDKSVLAPLRLLDVMSIFYLVQSSVVARRGAEGRLGQVMALFGRHSLEVFSVGTVIDLYARLVFTTFGDGWGLQIAVNVIGFAILWGLATVLDRRRVRQKEAAARAKQAAADRSGPALSTPAARAVLENMH
ncbi:OpgC domain-containing protein [Gluconacetobacter azotocaptans]|uniref:OpgC domain-containing protein n=2 Tax=Gluconacetobacter azotocaptans TaxID=142834 RepID=A0A7W4JV28_9PROT|nr:OpgC domain-containing protein [Gluconacetobacter azotocaptans]MBB2191345.1 OpgC domain-containing protein [Gluconacetobacter azotocaptans]